MHFERVSDLTVNASKGAIYFAGINTLQQQPLASSMGMPIGSFPIKNVGVPFSVKRLQVKMYSPLLDKILVRITS